MKANYNFKEFQAALKRVAPAISKDDTRPILQCVHIVGTAKRTQLEAADGFRAHFLDIDPADGTQAFDILLESATVKALVSAKVGRKDEPVIALDLENQKVLIDGKVITTGFGEGTYPDVNVLIPTHPAGSITVYPVPFLQAVKRARVFAREGSNVAKLHISESLLVIGKSEETGQSVNEVSLFQVRIAPLVIAFNADFLIDLLKLCGTEPVKIELTPPWYTKPEPWSASTEERAPALAESFTDDVFTSNPQPGALDWDIVTIESLLEDG